MKRLGIFIVVVAGLLATATVAKADQIRALLTGYEETPAAVSTTGRGEFIATIDPDSDAIHYRETFNGLQGSVTQSHIHVGQLSITGSIVIFLSVPSTRQRDWKDHGRQRHSRVSGAPAARDW